MTNFPINKHSKGQSTSNSPEDTEALGRQLAAYIVEHNLVPCVVLLNGGIGAGKTVFARGLAQGLGISEPIPSPTFPILLEYPGQGVALYHFDLYRLGDPEEFDLIGGEDILAGCGTYGPGVSVLEWPERLGENLEGILPDLGEGSSGDLGKHCFQCFQVHLSDPENGTQRKLLVELLQS